MLRGAGVLPDRRRAERGQRRALDAAGRHAEPGRRSAGAAQPVGLRRVLLAGAHDLGARRGVRGLPRLGRPGGPGVRGVPRATGSTSRSARCSVRRWRATAPTGRSTATAGAGLAGRRRRRRERRGRARPDAPTSRPAAPRGGARRAAQAGRGHRRDGRRRRAQSWPFGAVLPWGLSAVDWHAWALADAGRAGARLGRAGRHLAGRAGGARLGDVRPVAADLRRPGQRPAADPDRRRADRLRRRLAPAVAARHRRRHRLGRDAPAGRHRRGLVLRRQRVRTAGVRPGDRPAGRRRRRPTAA